MEKNMTTEETLQRIVRIIQYRDSFYREQWLEQQGWNVRQGKLMIDGFEDPESCEVLDAETAFIVAQTRDVMRLLDSKTSNDKNPYANDFD